MENKPKQTAVEWLEEQLIGSLGIELTKHQKKLFNDVFIKQAKEMEKQQIIETAINCFCEGKYSAEHTEKKISSTQLIKYAENYFEQIYHGKNTNN